MKKFFIYLSILIFSVNSIFAKPINADGPIPSGPKPKDRPSVCLVLAGGGSRGFAHLPIIQAIEEMGIPIDMVVGTSIGSIVGGVYCAGYSIPEINNILSDLNWTKLINDSATSPYEKILDEHSIFKNLLTLDFSMKMKLNLGKGLSNGQNIYSLLKELTLKYPSNIEFNDLHIPFRAVVTDMLDGEAMVLSDGDLAEAIRASMSIPAIFEPTELDGHYFIDGGIRYNLAINVAKNMGYDIVIGIDISQKVRDNPETYNSNPLVAMLNTITIGQYVSTSKLQKEADLVIYPDTSAYGTLDFKKGKEIYKKGEESVELYKEQLEEIRKRIFPKDYDSDGKRISEIEKSKTRGPYRRKSNLIPTEIQIEGAFPQDEKYILNAFKKINDKELTPENYLNFIESIYLTGNYISVTPRVYDDGERTAMHLILKQDANKEIKIGLGMDMEQVISNNRVTTFNLNPEFQIRGLTGSGSVLALRANSITNFGVSFYYMQPFNPNFFLQIDSTWLEDNYMAKEDVEVELKPGEKSKYSYERGTSFSTWNSNINIGLRTDNGNLLKICTFFDYSHTSNYIDNYVYDYVFKKYFGNDEIIDKFMGESPVWIPGVKINYVLDRMDRSAFSKKGVYLNSTVSCVFPFGIFDEIKPSVLGSLEIRGAIPFNKIFTLGIGANIGNEFTENLIDYFLAVPVEGFNTFDRVYFPGVSEKRYFGTKMAAGLVTLQIDPFDDLTILGGGILFRLTGTAGIIGYTYDHILMKDEEYKNIFPLIWSGSLDVGIRLKDGFNVLIRGGVTSTNSEEKKVTPFFALDIGSVRF